MIIIFINNSMQIRIILAEWNYKKKKKKWRPKIYSH